MRGNIRGRGRCAFLDETENGESGGECNRAGKSQGIKLSPLSKFYYEKKAGIENTYVMNYSSVDYGTDRKDCKRLEKIC